MANFAFFTLHPVPTLSGGQDTDISELAELALKSFLIAALMVGFVIINQFMIGSTVDVNEAFSVPLAISNYIMSVFEVLAPEVANAWSYFVKYMIALVTAFFQAPDQIANIAGGAGLAVLIVDIFSYVGLSTIDFVKKMQTYWSRESIIQNPKLIAPPQPQYQFQPGMPAGLFPPASVLYEPGTSMFDFNMEAPPTLELPGATYGQVGMSSYMIPPGSVAPLTLFNQNTGGQVDIGIMPIFTMVMVNLILTGLIFAPLIRRLYNYFKGRSDLDIAVRETARVLEGLQRVESMEVLEPLAREDPVIGELVQTINDPAFIVTENVPRVSQRRSARRSPTPREFQDAKDTTSGQELRKNWIALADVRVIENEIDAALAEAPGLVGRPRILEIFEQRKARQASRQKARAVSPNVRGFAQSPFVSQKSRAISPNVRGFEQSPFVAEPSPRGVVVPTVETFKKQELAECMLPGAPNTRKKFKVTEVVMDPVGNQYLKGLTSSKKEVLYPAPYCTHASSITIKTSPRVTPGGTVSPVKYVRPPAGQLPAAFGLTDAEQVEQIRKQYGNEAADDFAKILRSRERRGFRG